MEELLARLRVTFRRLNDMKSDMVQSSVFQNGDLKIDYAAGCAFMKNTELHLTPIEYKLLCLLSKNVGKVLTHTYITKEIWGSAWDNDVASSGVHGNAEKKDRGKSVRSRNISRRMWA